MEFKTDIEIAQSCAMKNITEIADAAGIDRKYIEQYGNYKAKVDVSKIAESEAKNGKRLLRPRRARARQRQQSDLRTD